MFVQVLTKTRKLMDNLTLETLPRAFTQLYKEVSDIKALLIKKQEEFSPESDRWLNLNDLCKYHPDKPTKPTVYGWVSSQSIPYHKSGKRLRFLKSEIDGWLKIGHRRAASEINEEANSYLSSKK